MIPCIQICKLGLWLAIEFGAKIMSRQLGRIRNGGQIVPESKEARSVSTKIGRRQRVSAAFKGEGISSGMAFWSAFGSQMELEKASKVDCDTPTIEFHGISDFV